MNELINVVGKSSISIVRKETPISGAWVDFYTDITAAEQKSILDGGDDIGYLIASFMVADWNFADENGEKVAISVDGIKQLPVGLQQWLAETANSVILEKRDEKKS